MRHLWFIILYLFANDAIANEVPKEGNASAVSSTAPVQSSDKKSSAPYFPPPKGKQARYPRKLLAVGATRGGSNTIQLQLIPIEQFAAPKLTLQWVLNAGHSALVTLTLICNQEIDPRFEQEVMSVIGRNAFSLPTERQWVTTGDLCKWSVTLPYQRGEYSMADIVAYDWIIAQ